MSKLDNLLSRLQKVKRTGKDSYTACCPAHDDHSPSLWIRDHGGDHLGFQCFAGCDKRGILQSIGLDWDDVLPDREPDVYRKPSRVPFNSRDVLASCASDAQLAYVFNCRAIAGEKYTPEEAANAQKALIRIIAATRMGGAQ